MRQFIEIMIFVLWLIGASASGLTVEWTNGPFASEETARHYAVTDALEFAVHDDRIALQLHVPALPWRIELTASVPASVSASLPETPVANAASDDASPRRGEGT